MAMGRLFMIARELDQNDQVDQTLDEKEKKNMFLIEHSFLSLKSIKIYYETIIYTKSIPKKNVLNKFYIP